jgi:KRAB domain-containing zinc finger protein
MSVSVTVTSLGSGSLTRGSKRLREEVTEAPVAETSGQRLCVDGADGTSGVDSIELVVPGYVPAEEKPFGCSMCRARFCFSSGLVRHMKTHTAVAGFVCGLCGKVLASNKTRLAHMSLHAAKQSGQRFVCNLCDQSFTLQCDLSRHRRTHAVEKPIGCSLCGQEFSRRSDLRRHKKVHTGPAKFECEICGKVLRSKAGLKGHTASHLGQRPFVCGTCGARFVSKTVLTMHEIMHTDKRKFGCGVCGKMFKYPSNITKHAKKCCVPKTDTGTGIELLV